MRRQTLVSTLSERYLRHAVKGAWKATWRAMKDVRLAEINTAGLGDEVRLAVLKKSKRVATVSVWVPSAEKLNLSAREEYFSDSMTGRPGAFFDCVLAFCSSDEMSFEMLNSVALCVVKVKS